MGRVAQLVQTLIWILFPFRGWPESSIVFRFRKGGDEQEVTRSNKQSYSHLWGTLPKSLGACENVNKKHILLILLLVDCGNGPTDFNSWKDTNRTWKGHGKDMWHERKRKWMHMLRNEMIRQAMTTNQKLSPKGWKSLVTTTTTLRITFLGSYRRTPMRDRLKARFKNLFNWGFRDKKYSFWIWDGFGKSFR